MADSLPAPSDERRGALGNLAAAVRFLLRGSTRGLSPDQAAALVTWVTPVGLLIGLAWAGVFRVSWRVYGEAERLRIVPALVVLLLEALVTGRYLLLSIARVADVIHDEPAADPDDASAKTRFALEDFRSPPGWHGTLLLLLSGLAIWTLIVSDPQVNPWWPPPEDWRSRFNLLYPRPIYRPLLLAPIWGRWGVLLAACVGRTARHADAATRAFCDAMRPARLLRHALLPLVLTCIYFSRERNFLIGAVIGLLVLAVSYVGSVWMARRLGGQSRSTLLATGLLAQLAFLTVYRAMWRLIYLQ